MISFFAPVTLDFASHCSLLQMESSDTILSDLIDATLVPSGGVIVINDSDTGANFTGPLVSDPAQSLDGAASPKHTTAKSFVGAASPKSPIFTCARNRRSSLLKSSATSIARSASRTSVTPSGALYQRSLPLPKNFVYQSDTREISEGSTLPCETRPATSAEIWEVHNSNDPMVQYLKANNIKFQIHKEVIPPDAQMMSLKNLFNKPEIIVPMEEHNPLMPQSSPQDAKRNTGSWLPTISLEHDVGPKITSCIDKIGEEMKAFRDLITTFVTPLIGEIDQIAPIVEKIVSLISMLIVFVRCDRTNRNLIVLSVVADLGLFSGALRLRSNVIEVLTAFATTIFQYVIDSKIAQNEAEKKLQPTVELFSPHVPDAQGSHDDDENVLVRAAVLFTDFFSEKLPEAQASVDSRINSSYMQKFKGCY